jgi:hypothetical protein
MNAWATGRLEPIAAPVSYRLKRPRLLSVQPATFTLIQASVFSQMPTVRPHTKPVLTGRFFSFSGLMELRHRPHVSPWRGRLWSASPILSALQSPLS